MDLQNVLDAMGAKHRRETMQESDQLMLGELTLLFEHVADPMNPVVFDDGTYRPSGLGSWRGSYRELAIRYDDEIGLPGTEFLSSLKEADGKTYTGYKGGDFTMSSNTPVWVANRGESQGFKTSYQGVVGVREDDDQIVIETEEVPF